MSEKEKNVIFHGTGTSSMASASGSTRPPEPKGPPPNARANQNKGKRTGKQRRRWQNWEGDHGQIRRRESDTADHRAVNELFEVNWNHVSARILVARVPCRDNFSQANSQLWTVTSV